MAREYSLTLKGELSVWPDLEKFCQFGEMSIKYLGSFEVNIKFCFCFEPYLASFFDKKQILNVENGQI